MPPRRRQFVRSVAAAGLSLVAGCAAAEGGRSDAGVGIPPGRRRPLPFPPGWSAAGVADAAEAVGRARSIVADTDFTERVLQARPIPNDPAARVTVTVQSVTFDYDHRRVLLRREYYRLPADALAAVGDLGDVEVADRAPLGVEEVYGNRRVRMRHVDVDGGQRTTVRRDRNYSTAADGSRPVAYGSIVRLLDDAKLAQTGRATGGIQYRVTDLVGAGMRDGTGRLAVASDGLLTSCRVSGWAGSGPAALYYRVDTGDRSLAEPAWVSGSEVN